MSERSRTKLFSLGADDLQEEWQKGNTCFSLRQLETKRNPFD